MYHFQKHFTIEEARALLPELRRILQEAQQRRDAVQRADAELGELLQRSKGDLGGKRPTALLMDMLQLNTQLRRVQGMGIQVKDFDRGLLDFPHIRDGQEVFLCWELDEDDIEFWHDLDDGFAGRERL